MLCAIYIRSFVWVSSFWGFPSLCRTLYTSHECGYISLSIHPSHTYSGVCVCVYCAHYWWWCCYCGHRGICQREARARVRESGRRTDSTLLCERSVDFCTTISSCPLCLTSLLIVKSEYRHPWINLPFNSIRLEDLYNIVECGGSVMVVLFHHFSPVIAQL